MVAGVCWLPFNTSLGAIGPFSASISWRATISSKVKIIDQHFNNRPFKKKKVLIFCFCIKIASEASALYLLFCPWRTFAGKGHLGLLWRHRGENCIELSTAIIRDWHLIRWVGSSQKWSATRRFPQWSFVAESRVCKRVCRLLQSYNLSYFIYFIFLQCSYTGVRSQQKMLPLFP